MLLREVIPADVPIFYEHQADPEAARLVAFASRDRAAHAEHLATVLADPETIIRTIVEEGDVAGQVLSFPRDGVREVGYWLGRDFWGRGLATQALGAFLDVDRSRPLHGVVAEHNVASRRVLEHHGFVVVDRHDPSPDDSLDGAVPLLVLRLDG